MDKRAREIIGLPVLSFSRGTKISEVHDLIIDPERKQVLALGIEHKSFFPSARAVPMGRIKAIGPHAVIVPDGKAVIEVDRDTLLKRLYNRQIVRGLKVLTEDGQKLGEVSDMLLDGETGEVKGYYVSIGRVLDVTQGSRWLPAESIISLGLRVLYVPSQVATDFEQQSGGWSGALDQAGGRLLSAGGIANTRLEEMGFKAKEAGGRLNQQLGQLGDQVRDTLPQRGAALVVGRTAHNSVIAPDGTPIVQEGAQITDEHIEAARQTSRLPQLFLAAGTGPARQGAGAFGEQASQSLQDIRTEARDLWQQITGQYTRNVDQADDKVMQRRIKSALGRPASRVILDNDDNVILNTGDIITNRAVQAAREAGVLDILVDSVYNERPKLDTESLKAPGSGSASLTASTGSGGNGGARTSLQTGLLDTPSQQVEATEPAPPVARSTGTERHRSR